MEILDWSVIEVAFAKDALVEFISKEARPLGLPIDTDRTMTMLFKKKNQKSFLTSAVKPQLVEKHHRSR